MEKHGIVYLLVIFILMLNIILNIIIFIKVKKIRQKLDINKLENKKHDLALFKNYVDLAKKFYSSEITYDKNYYLDLIEFWDNNLKDLMFDDNLNLARIKPSILKIFKNLKTYSDEKERFEQEFVILDNYINRKLKK